MREYPIELSELLEALGYGATHKSHRPSRPSDRVGGRAARGPTYDAQIDAPGTVGLASDMKRSDEEIELLESIADSLAYIRCRRTESE